MQKKWIQMKKDRRGDIGVGTMIIFIAMVLVAAVAASVLISTANSVREQATQTGDDAIADVSSGFDVEYVTGTAAGNAITGMDVYVKLSAGSPSIDLGNVILSVTAGSASGAQTFGTTAAAGVAGVAGAADTPGVYTASIVSATQPTDFTSYNTVDPGNLVDIQISFVGTAGMSIAPGDSVTIKIMPAEGTASLIQFTVPAILTTGTMTLR